MAYYTIQKRNKKYACQVRWYVDGGARKSKSRTFGNRASAEAWGHQEAEKITENADLPPGPQERADIKTLGQLIDAYLMDDAVKIGRSKAYSLRLVRDCDVSRRPLKVLRPKDVVDFCKDRRAAGAAPSTVACDVSNLRSVLKVASALFGVDISEQVVVDSMATLNTLGLVGKPKVRTRRPSEVELDKLRLALESRELKQSSKIPFCDILNFSILTCMRISEVCALKWCDFDPKEKSIIVRDRKDPRKKQGNYMKVPLLGGADEIILRQPKNSDIIFPYKPRSVTAGFQRVRNKIGIADLRYHDLRREGASRLFEKGYVVHEVAQVTGHRNLNTLWNIYTNLDPARLANNPHDPRRR